MYMMSRNYSHCLSSPKDSMRTPRRFKIAYTDPLGGEYRSLARYAQGGSGTREVPGEWGII